jgi:hypothetical protein
MVDSKKVISIKRTRRVVERNLALFEEWTRYLINHPRILENLPDKFELVMLPDDDDELRRYNLQLLSIYGSEGRVVVFVRLRSTPQVDFEVRPPDVYVPLPLAI